MQDKERTRQSMQEQNTPSINQREQYVGRAAHHETHGISNIDCQEGTMNNGVVGGNFSEISGSQPLTSDSNNGNK